jgi:hypothetical protein
VSGPKLVTRQAMKDFEAEGIKVLNSPHGNKNLFHLAKRYPQLLQELLGRVQKAGDLERSLWGHMITQLPLHEFSYSVSDRTPHYYRKWFSLLPMVLDLFPRVEAHNSNHEPRILHDRINSLAEVIANAEHKRRFFADDDGYRRVKAIMTVVQTDKAASGTGRVKDRNEDIDFIAEHMDAIEPIVPELMRRGTSDRGIIGQILSSDARSLNDGIL